MKFQIIIHISFNLIRGVFKPSGAGGAEGASAPPKFSVDVLFLLIGPLKVFFLNEVTKNVLENQRAKSRAS